MPKARHLAPWHRADLWEALEAEGEGCPENGDDGAVEGGPGSPNGTRGLSGEELEKLRGKPAIYHCISRVVHRQFLFGEAEREQFVAYMRLYEQFCQVRVLAFCVMSNHFHILLEVPAPPERRGADWSDERLLTHLKHLYDGPKLGEIRAQLALFREQKNSEGAEDLRESFFRRMWDLSEFMMTLKQRFTRWFNRHHERQGTLWEARFKSVLVEDGHAARTMAGYIDLNPVRAGMVKDPKDYRWCTYAEAVAGKRRAREGLQRVMCELESTLTSEERAAEMLLSWRKAARGYRELLEASLLRNEADFDPKGIAPLSEAQALCCRVRYFTDGMALGTQGFIEQVFGLSKDRFGPKRTSGARGLKRIDTELCALRDLQLNVVTVDHRP